MFSSHGHRSSFNLTVCLESSRSKDARSVSAPQPSFRNDSARSNLSRTSVRGPSACSLRSHETQDRRRQKQCYHMLRLLDLLASNHTGVGAFLAVLHLDPVPGRQCSCISMFPSDLGVCSTFGAINCRVPTFAKLLPRDEHRQ